MIDDDFFSDLGDTSMQDTSAAVDREYATDLLPRPTPERHLLVAILERALRDVQSHADPIVRARALNWFKSKRRYVGEDNCFGFLDIIEYLGVGVREVKLIHKHISEGEQFHKDYVNEEAARPKHYPRRRVVAD